MENLKFFLHVLFTIIWPVKGIIYMEEQALQWCYAYLSVLLANYGYVFLIIFGIALMISMGHYRHVLRGTRGIIIATLIWALTVIVNTVLAWIYLLYGAVNGRIDNSHQPHRISVQRGHHNHLDFRFDANNPTLHYRMGRGLYRIFFNGLTALARVRIFRFLQNRQVRSIIARCIALIIIVWGVWHIPYDLTH